MDETSQLLLNQPVVIDNGSGSIKAGFAGEERPKSYAPSIIGRPKYSRVMAGALETDTFIGNQAQENRGLLKLSYPLEHGMVTNWDDIERLWSYVFRHDLNTATEDHPVLLTEAPLNPKLHRDRCAQIFFETFNTPALYVSIQAVLALYASGRTTGVVLDSGDGVTHVVPVYEGFSLPSAIRRVDIAGRDVTEHLQLLLRKSGYALQTSAEKEIVRAIKEKFCYLSPDPVKSEKEWETLRFINTTASDDTSMYSSYKLPDGQILKIGPERFRAPEILFKPDLIGSECSSVPEILQESIQKVDLDLRAALYLSVVLSGGTTLTKGFGDRLLAELKIISPKGMKIKIYAPPERKYSTWIGGSILAGLSTFKRMWVSAAEYEENPDIIHAKCL
ncbi:hypothetical protein BABINDRAFT_62246 [Babjeviella inositovora NRRL Y-12698]|uniref:Actin n=1 Tax=Babjeviella inositovora NRRL Y-12698 TaxID=984486 RepID=A0A1E3QQ91_9ASCO|nr:uncharacterized protein BABINDRAFT_62246 [Babjeviella inositovora NRRL Y-12698]ODQ79876.1 hypothetical protein BABINDRAFT_62246 [Babjeviella inositovora NRRL Y-12698]